MSEDLRVVAEVRLSACWHAELPMLVVAVVLIRHEHGWIDLCKARVGYTTSAASAREKNPVDKDLGHKKCCASSRGME